MNYNLASNVFTNIDDLHIINIICKISINEDLADFTSLIQKQLLPTLGATIWVWYWQDSEQAPLELISVVNSQKYYSISNNPTPPTLDIDQQLIEDNVPLLSSNEHFDFQDKTALSSLLKKHSLSKVKNNFNTHYKAIIHTPELIGFSVLGLNKFVPCHYQLIELIAPIMLLQKRNLIRKDMLRMYLRD